MLSGPEELAYADSRTGQGGQGEARATLEAGKHKARLVRRTEGEADSNPCAYWIAVETRLESILEI